MTAFGSRVWALVCVAWLVVTWAWSGLHLAMTVDDTFYYFKTALNISRGLGSTFDGINPTNGYHPLWLGLLSVVFSLFRDDLVFLTRVAFTLQIVMIWAGGVVLSRLKAAGGSWVFLPLTLAMLNPFTAKIVLCGQETALQFLLSSVALAYWWKLRSSPVGASSPRGWAPALTRRWIILGILCALATLARLDTIFYAALLLGMPVILPSDAERELGFAGRLKTSILGTAAFVLGLLPYLAFNAVKYKHLMPVSGAIKLHLEASELSPFPARVAVSILAAGGLLWLWLAARRRSSTDLPFLAPPLGACLIGAIYNFGVRGEMSPSLVRVWYLEPYLLAFAVALGAFAVSLGASLHARRLPRFATLAITRGAVVLWVVFCVFTWRYRLEPRSYGIYAAAARCSQWFDRNTAPTAVAAAWDAGFAASLTRKPVMNLDGLISSWEFKENYLDRGEVDTFISKRHPTDYVIQYAWPATLRGIARRSQGGGPALPVKEAAGERSPSLASGRWGIDLSSFYVAHVECVMVSVAYKPSETVGPVQYFVLSRAPVPDRPTLAEFAVRNASRESCD